MQASGLEGRQAGSDAKQIEDKLACFTVGKALWAAGEKGYNVAETVEMLFARSGGVWLARLVNNQPGTGEGRTMMSVQQGKG